MLVFQPNINFTYSGLLMARKTSVVEIFFVCVDSLIIWKGNKSNVLNLESYVKCWISAFYFVFSSLRFQQNKNQLLMRNQQKKMVRVWKTCTCCAYLLVLNTYTQAHTHTGINILTQYHTHTYTHTQVELTISKWGQKCHITNDLFDFMGLNTCTSFLG